MFDIFEMENLWYAHNHDEKFSLFVLADSEDEALSIVMQYAKDSKLKVDGWRISGDADFVESFREYGCFVNCDRIISSSDIKK